MRHPSSLVFCLLPALASACWPLIRAEDVRHEDLGSGAPGPVATPPEPTEPPAATEPIEPTEPAETEPSTDVVLDLVALEPNFGSNGGDLEVVLTGSFGADVQVTVDGVDAPVFDWSPDELRVLVPPSDEVGWVEVEVVSAGQRETFGQGFRYFEDATGSTTLAGTLSFTETVGDYWYAPQADTSSGFFSFSEPTEWSLDQLYGVPLGSCQLDVWGPPIPSVDHGATEAVLESPFGSIDFEVDAVGTFFSVYEADLVVPGTPYDLLAVAGNSDWPAFELDDVVSVPPRFSVTLPDVDSFFVPYVQRSTRIEWTGSGGDYVLIELFLGSHRLLCSAPDTGSFTVDGSLWPQWPRGAVMYLKVGRALEAGGRMPTDNGDIEMAGVYWVYGAAYTQ